VSKGDKRHRKNHTKLQNNLQCTIIQECNTSQKRPILEERAADCESVGSIKTLLEEIARHIQEAVGNEPVEADGTRFGDWEMNTIVDSFGHAILTLTERSNIEKLPYGRKALPMALSVTRLLFPYRRFLKTITTDNGCEFAAHLKIARLLSMKTAIKSSSTLLILIPHGRKGRLKTQTSSYENIFQRNQTVTISLTSGFWKYKNQPQTARKTQL